MSAARQVASESSEDEYFSVGAHAYGAADTSDSDADTAETASMAPPRHPVSAMQGAFEESIYESSDPNPNPKSKDDTAEARRQRVLESRHYDDSWTKRWKQNPGARHHPLAKLMAQIVFGMHLLQQQAAKSDEEVVRILQTHVDEVDNFLEKTTEDFDLAIKDIAERIHFLKLPMAHPDVFGTMLEEKQFRTQLMEGNEKIDAIIERTSRVMDAALLDMSRAKTATKELGRYLNAVSDEWPGEKQDLEAVFNAMRGNEQGWKHCLRELQAKAHELRDNLEKLSNVLNEMARMAEAASKRVRAHGRAASAGQSGMSSIPRSKFNNDAQRSRAMSVDKPLPKEPINTDGPVELEAHPVLADRRQEQSRAIPTSPERTRESRSSTVPPRPTTSSSMTPREARNTGRDSTRDIIEFLKEARQQSPLRSHPPDDAAGLTRSAKRQSAIDVMEHAKALSNGGTASRPQTADSSTALPRYRRGSEPVPVEPRREGIERNKHGPPPSGSGRGRRESSIGYVALPGLQLQSHSLTPHSPRFMRRLSFRSSSRNRADQSPPPARSSAPQIPPIATIDQPSDSRLITPPNKSTNQQPNTTVASTKRTTSPTLAPPITNTQLQPSEPPSTPSATSNSGRSTNQSPSLTVTTPGTENLSPATKSDSTEKARPPSRPKLANGNSATNGHSGSKASLPPQAKTSFNASAALPEEKKRGRGMSFRRFFGSSTRERVPRAAMTYGDLA